MVEQSKASIFVLDHEEKGGGPGFESAPHQFFLQTRLRDNRSDSDLVKMLMAK